MHIMGVMHISLTVVGSLVAHKPDGRLLEYLIHVMIENST